MREVDIHFGPDVDLDGISDKAIRSMVVAASVFTRWGFDCWVTSAVRKDDDNSLHKFGMAVDFDSSSPLTSALFTSIREDMAAILGDNYDVIYHLGHIHSEYDPGGLGVVPYKESG